MSDELTAEDWKQIALFYQKKFSDIEMQVLSMELSLAKQNQAAQEPAPVDEDE